MIGIVIDPYHVKNDRKFPIHITFWDMIGWRDRYHKLRMVKGSGCICSASMKTNVKIDVREKKEPCLRGGGRNSRDMRWRAAWGSETGAADWERSCVCLTLQVGPAFPGLQCAVDLATNQLSKERLPRRARYWMSWQLQKAYFHWPFHHDSFHHDSVK